MLQITSSPKLSELTTLGIGGTSIALIDVYEEHDLDHIPGQIQRLGGKSYLLGGGSNILAADTELPFVLIRTKILKEPQVIHVDKDGQVFVKVYAAMGLARFLAWCSKHGLSGMESFAGIPGTVGGAIAGNAGSYGMSICECIHEIDIFSFTHGLRVLNKNDIQYRYRCFSIDEDSGSFAIISAIIPLRHDAKEQIIARIRSNVAKKTSTQPMQVKSAGCIFKNSECNSAGKLLDQAGFKGKGRNGISFSPLHANFLVNDGHGKSSVAFELLQEARQTVKDTFDIDLQTEVRVWTCS